MAERIVVNAPGGDYDIVIGVGLIQQLAANWGKNRVAVVTNTTVAPLYGQSLVEAQRQRGTTLIAIPDGEQYKTLDTVAKLYNDFITAGLDRTSTIIALGGGVVGDTAGFAAATFMRGVYLLQMPTTLLSMVDSSVGGKVGVDLPQGKNLVGAFKQPDMVVIDPDVLQTLPDREWRCGMAEVVKHGLLADEALLDSTLWTRERAAEMVRRAVQVKIDIVQQDPFEKNIRAHLNLGHTFAHAVEQASAYKWQHGEAVGFGLVAALRLSHALGLCDTALAGRVEEIVKSIGLPVRLDDLAPSAIYSAMSSDKKWESGRSRFVLLKAIGQPQIVENVPKAEVIRVLESLA